MKKIFTITAVLILLSAVCWAEGTMESTSAEDNRKAALKFDEGDFYAWRFEMYKYESGSRESKPEKAASRPTYTSAVNDFDSRRIEYTTNPRNYGEEGFFNTDIQRKESGKKPNEQDIDRAIAAYEASLAAQPSGKWTLYPYREGLLPPQEGVKERLETAKRIKQEYLAVLTRSLRDDDFEVKQNPDNTITITGFKFSDGRDVVIPETLYGLKVTIIGNSAFTGLNVRSVVIPDTVVEVGAGAFSSLIGGLNPGGNENAKLRSVTIGKSVRTIGGGAFSGQPLTEITFPDSVTEIGNFAFANCGLTSVTWGRGLQRIGDSAFNSNELTSLTIPSSVKELGVYAFSNNGKIQSVSIPNSNIVFTGVGYGSYFGGKQITRAVLPANLDSYSMASRWGFDESLINFYVSQGRAAGTYVKNGQIWTRQ